VPRTFPNVLNITEVVQGESPRGHLSLAMSQLPDLGLMRTLMGVFTGMMG
jgi:hypothetical protein